MLLSETHWTDAFNVKLKAYHIAKKNRLNRIGGGVAIFIHKSLQFLSLNLKETKKLFVLIIRHVISSQHMCQKETVTRTK